MAKSKYQNYETETIHRTQIKNAPYNPRIMGKEAEQLLRKQLAKNGLVSAPTWNVRTGNLVGGHQRLKQLDALEKTQDYELTVCVVDVDERQEAILNIELNNESMQGEWDLDKLADMRDDFDLDFTHDLSFSEIDVDFMFSGDDHFSELFRSEEREQMEGDLETVKEARKQGVEKLKERNNINWYLMVVFPDEDHRNAFMRDISMPIYEEVVTEDQIRRLEARNND